ncbi:pyridoxamine 5'-phosphate oxidase family protein [Primorskyibacter aestuariivivens]|uniref:pyridoxamine 5'-phosphate oxidase family protein n=1 Tax=Primorskyibacter aestuariivivens TaxID=1888912 RepID=UPI002300E0F7|nr:pyridoxamine 5'-phosphate oxidase family protein [Primorskyibacter aestuariivivens]MDA7427248.1 pyridoxamine 5'-phosphate oxidase family protein [Primorskyibacter aestuariivivens]
MTRTLTTLEGLHALYGEPVPAALRKVVPQLTPSYRAWIEGSRFCVISTVGPNGTDGSPRGDDGPVVRVADEKTLMMPDWRGNNRLDTLRNIIRDPRVALLFLIPGSKTTVRVNGRAFLTDEPEVLQSFEQRGKHPATVIVIEIDEVYIQCAKALMRSGLWGRDDAETVPTVGEILAEVTNGEVGCGDYDATYEEKAQPRLW